MILFYTLLLQGCMRDLRFVETAACTLRLRKKEQNEGEFVKLVWVQWRATKIVKGLELSAESVGIEFSLEQGSFGDA